MHYKAHVGIVVLFVANNEQLVEDFVSYSIFLYLIFEGKDVSDISIVKPHILDVA